MKRIPCLKVCVTECQAKHCETILLIIVDNFHRLFFPTYISKILKLDIKRSLQSTLKLLSK